MNEFKLGHIQVYFSPANKHETKHKNIAEYVALEHLAKGFMVKVAFNAKTGIYTVYWGA